MTINWFTAFVAYVMIWWTTLFAVLPLGTRPSAEADPVTGWRGAPERPRIVRKALITTAIATAIWLIVMAVGANGWVSFRPD